MEHSIAIVQQTLYYELGVISQKCHLILATNATIKSNHGISLLPDDERGLGKFLIFAYGRKQKIFQNLAYDLDNKIVN